MARIRSLKPDYYLDEGLSEVSLEAHFLLSGLWCIADREGRLEDRPRRIKVQVFPYRDVDVDKALGELHAAGCVVRYEVEGKRLVQVQDWERDQRPHVREPESLFPPPLERYTEHLPCTDPAQAKHGRVPGEFPASSPPSTNPARRDLGSGVRDPGPDQVLAGSPAHPPVATLSDTSAEEMPQADPADVTEDSAPSPTAVPTWPAALQLAANHPAAPESSREELRLNSPRAAHEAREAGQRPEDLQALWNELAPPKGLQRWEAMSKGRRSAARVSLEQVPDLARWRAWLASELARPFNLGDGVKGAWKADVDWLLRAKTRDLVADFNPAAAPAGQPAAATVKWREF